VTSEARNISDVTSIDLAGSADVDITLGETESLVVEAEDNIIPLIETKVQNGQLVIGRKSGAGYSSTKPVTVHVTLKSLAAVSLSGSGSISVPDSRAIPSSWTCLVPVISMSVARPTARISRLGDRAGSTASN
jgi:hypothetical protein